MTFIILKCKIFDVKNAATFILVSLVPLTLQHLFGKDIVFDVRKYGGDDV